MDGLPYKCRYCGRDYCSKHRLPENHNCKELGRLKKDNPLRWKKEFEEEFLPNREEHNSSEKPVQCKLSLFSKLKAWLNEREHNKYNFRGRLNYLVTTVLILAASIVGFSIFYNNAQKLNGIDLWIIKLGGVLILTSLFFIIKFGWRLGRELINISKRQRNWIKYLIIIFIAILLWHSYTHRDTIMDPIVQVYNKTNFSLFSPLDFRSVSSGSNIDSNIDNSHEISNFIDGITDPKSQINVSQLEQKVHLLINIQRANNGLSALSFDSDLTSIARSHSQDMVLNSFFKHINLKGQDPTARANAVGYSCYKNYGSYYTDGIGENIALIPIHPNVERCGNTTNLDSLAECIVDSWMTSPGHRENILTAAYDKEGIGVAYSLGNEAYITQDFC